MNKSMIMSKLKTVGDFSQRVDDYHYQPVLEQIAEAIEILLQERELNDKMFLSLEVLKKIRKKVVDLIETSDVVYNHTKRYGGDKKVTKKSLEFIDNEIEVFKSQC